MLPYMTTMSPAMAHAVGEPRRVGGDMVGVAEPRLRPGAGPSRYYPLYQSASVSPRSSHQRGIDEKTHPHHAVLADGGDPVGG